MSLLDAEPDAAPAPRSYVLHAWVSRRDYEAVAAAAKAQSLHPDRYAAHVLELHAGTLDHGRAR